MTHVIHEETSKPLTVDEPFIKKLDAREEFIDEDYIKVG
jgi:hypothetical protein